MGVVGTIASRYRKRVSPLPTGPPIGPSLPPGYIVVLPGRGETFARVNVGSDQGRPTLFLLHGWTATADLQWCTAYEALGVYNFVAIDHRGHGRGIRSEEPLTFEAAADDAAATLRALGHGPVIAVGYSMGGPIAMQLCRRHPDLVRGLVLVATALEWRAKRWERLHWRTMPVVEGFFRSRFALRYARRVLAFTLDDDGEVGTWASWMMAELRRGDPRALREVGDALARHDARPWARELGVPSAVLVTADDRWVWPRKQRALAKALGADVVEVRGDHLTFLSHPDDFADALAKAIGIVESAKQNRSQDLTG